MSRKFRLALLLCLIPAVSYAAVSKLSDINNGGTIVPSTDQCVAVRTGNTDELVSFAASAAIDTTNASNISSGTLACSHMPALTSAATTSAGSCAVTLTAPSSTSLGGVEAFTSTSGNCLTGVDSNGVFSSAACSGGGGAVGSVSNADGTLTISPTTGNVVASLNSGHANNWTNNQTFSSNLLVSGHTTFEGVTSVGATGTQNIVYSSGSTLNSATLASPALGTPVSGVATNLTGTAAGLTAGSVTTINGLVSSAGINTQSGSGTVANPVVVTGTIPNPAAATLGGVFSFASTANGFITGLQTSGAFISSALGLSQFPLMSGNTMLGVPPGASSTPIALSSTQSTAMCQAFSSTLSGCVPASAGTANNVLFASGTFSQPTTNNLSDIHTFFISTTGTSLTSQAIVSSTLASAFAVGPNGVTNPTLVVDDSTASLVNGISIKGAAASSKTIIAEIGTGTNTSSGIAINDKTQGVVSLANLVASFSDTTAGTNITLAPKNQSTIGTTTFTYAEGTDTGLTPGTDVHAISFNTGSGGRSWGTGALPLDRDMILTGTLYKFTAASTITDGAALGFVLGGCGTNATCTNLSGIYHASTALVSTGAITNSYGINVAADTGATNNYSASFTGGKGMVYDGMISKGTKFTISGCSADTTVGGATAGSFVSHTMGVCNVTITMNGATGMTAPNGWSCWASDQTTPANIFDQNGGSTTTSTFTGTTASGDVINFGCMGY